MTEATFKYVFVLDFEATCDTEEQMKRNEMEVIEFPTVVYDVEKREVVDEFHRYVKATRHRVSPFCTELTGITQEVSDAGGTFQEVLAEHEQWMQRYLEEGAPFLYATCGDWDLRHMLPMQCKQEGLRRPAYFDRFMNVKRPFAALTGKKAKGMAGMLRDLRIPLEGRHHSGIDDTRNIVKIVDAIVAGGVPLRVTGQWTNGLCSIDYDSYKTASKPPLQARSSRKKR